LQPQLRSSTLVEVWLRPTYKVEEVRAEDAIPVLRKYIAEIRVTRPYFDATPNSSDEAVAAELSRHAVFRLIPSTPNRHGKR
jgi:hypothetical protein